MPGRARRLAPEGRTARRRSRASRKGRAAIQGTCRNDLHSSTTYNELATPPASRSPPLSRIFAFTSARMSQIPNTQHSKGELSAFELKCLCQPAAILLTFFTAISTESLNTSYPSAKLIASTGRCSARISLPEVPCLLRFPKRAEADTDPGTRIILHRRNKQ